MGKKARKPPPRRKSPGAPQCSRPMLRARLTADGRVETFPSEGSGRVSGLSWAEGLVDLGDAGGAVTPGDPVDFLPFHGFTG